MTISLARKQRLAAIAKAHDEWVDGQLAAVSPEFDPSAHPKPGSDYNQHNVDVDASGEAEDELAAKVAAIFGELMTAAGDPDWDESEHPRGPDGKFIESGDIVSLEKEISETSVLKSIAYMKDEKYQAQALHEKLMKLEQQLEDMKAAAKKQLGMPEAALVPTGMLLSPSAIQVGQYVAIADTPGTAPGWADPSRVLSVYKKNGQYIIERENGVSLALFPNKKVKVFKLDGKESSVSISPAPKLSPAPKAVGGFPITAWTKAIYAKYEDGQIVAVHADGNSRVVWDAEDKKFLLQTKSAYPSSSGWILKEKLNKKSAYDKFKNQKLHWLTPTPGATVTNTAPPPPGFEHGPAGAPQPFTTSPSSPQFKILPRGERGKSGDGYFAGNFWGKYGAAGLMMRHTDENGTERFLLVQANMMDNPDTFGKWQLPGGAIEEMETPEQGAAREVFEELGFDQDFLYNMKQRETHQVTFDVPGFGPWSYSNITVDVPTRPEPKFDPYELGGAKWVTAGELSMMRAKGEIIKPLEANFDAILHKFHDEPAVSKAPKVQPDPPGPVRKLTPDAPTVSQQTTAPSTTWTKSKFNATVASKTSYENREVVGMADFAGMYTTRIVWENGKFRWYKHDSVKGWQYEGTWSSKKNALSALKDVPFYRPPKGTMADTNKDYISGMTLSDGLNTITVQADAEPDVLSSLMDGVTAPSVGGDTFGKLTTGPWTDDGKPFMHYKTSMKVHVNGTHIGALHEQADGTWLAAVSWNSGRGKYMPGAEFFTKIDALQAMSAANDAYEAAKVANASPIDKPSASPVTKKVAKLTAAQIEKQNGAVPKTLKQSQRTNFLKNFKENSSVGFVHSSEMDTQKVFTALVSAVKRHNAAQSPKLNYLQGLNLLDQVYGTNQKSKVVTWLGTSEGKALAPVLVNGSSGSGSGVVVPANSPTGVPSAYSIGTPKKVATSAFRQMSLTDMLEMHAEMYAQKPMTSEQRSHISAYKNNSDSFNQPLRGNPNPFNKLSAYNLPGIQKLQSAMRPATQSFIAYRGTDGLGSVINKDTIKNLADMKKFEGAIVGDPAFLSTSFDPSAAFSDKRFKLIINVPEGTPGTFAYAASSGFEYEKEFTLAAGLHFKIDRVEEMIAGHDNGYFNIYMTVIPEVKQK